MTYRFLWAVIATIALSAAARADIIIRSDGHAFGGKVLSQNDKEVVEIPDYCDASGTEHLMRSFAVRVVTTDEHGALLTDNDAPAARTAAPIVSPPDPVAPPLGAAPPGPTYYLIPLHGEVGETVLASALEKSLADAVARHPTVVVLDIDSPGGLVDEALQILKVLHRYNKKLRIVALTNQDLSAAAISTLSVKEIYVKNSSTIGAATSYVPSNLMLPPKLEEKMQSVWRAEARNSAEEGGHDPLLADAMIDNDRELHWETVNGKPVVKEGPGDHMICRKGKILTLSSHEAVACGLASGEADDVDELGQALKLDHWKEIKGLGTALADALPERVKTYQAELETIRTRFVKDLAAAEKADPSQAVTTVTRVVTAGPTMPANPRSPRPMPGMPPRPGVQSPQIVVEKRGHPTAAWKGDSLECVLALQQSEVDLKEAMALATTYGRTSEEEMVSEALGKISAIRAGIYDDRDKFLKNIFPPGVLQTGEAGSKSGGGYVVTNSRYPQVIGFRYNLTKVGTKQVIASLDPIFVKPNAEPANGTFEVMAKDGYAVGGLIVNATTDNINAVKIIFMACKDGRMIPTDTYRSDWLGLSDGHDPQIIAGKGQTVVGTCGRKNGVLVAIGLLVQESENKK